MTTLKELEERAHTQINSASDDPQARLALRLAFYKKYGFSTSDSDPEGYGRAELDFTRWEIRRGALEPTTGSAWWRAMQSEFSYHSLLAGLIHDAGIDAPNLSIPVKHWLNYINNPSAKTWYIAHNTSIIDAYFNQTVLAHREELAEQIFINEVLYRLLFAQALVEGEVLGIIGEIAADPRLFSVEFITSLNGLYPQHYPLDLAETRYVRHDARGLEAELAEILDLDLILPHIEALYDWAAALNSTPLLPDLLFRARPIYPHQSAGPVPPTKKKLAVLGGGMAALSTVLEVTQYPDWHHYYDITIYLQGWRMGGKAATGRGLNNRIEERGLHIFQGWYDNAFHLVQQMYAERRARGLAPKSPFQSWEEAFLRNDGTLLTEYLPEQGGWVPWPALFPRTSELPGYSPPPTIWEQIKKVLTLLCDTLFGSPYAHHFLSFTRTHLKAVFPEPSKPTPSFIDSIVDTVADAVEGLNHSIRNDDAAELHRKVTHIVRRIGPHTSTNDVEDVAMAFKPIDALIKLLEGISHALHLVSEAPNGLRRILLCLDLGVSSLKGLLRDCWNQQTDTFNFNAINHLDFREWLRQNGAPEEVTNSVVVRFFYTGTFANQYPGDQAGGQIAAGLALQGVLAAFGYKGSFVWQTRAGTGDTLVMPMYQVLKARGVAVQWFHRVEKIHWSDGADVETIELTRQVDLTADYDPTIVVPWSDADDAEIIAWPLEPNYQYINPAQAKKLQENKINLESQWADWSGVGAVTLTKGTDFDDILLAIPIKATERICADFRKSEKWAAMFDNVKSTMTMAAQMYFEPSLKELGYIPSEWGMAPTDCALNLVTYANPQYSWVDTSQVLPAETWPADNTPKAIGLWCGALNDPPVMPPLSDHSYPERQRHEIDLITQQWVQDNMAFFLPKGATVEAPAGLDWTHLIDCENRASPTRQQRWSSQYFWANCFDDLRFTLSIPGSNQFRLSAAESGFDNLFLAGDWVDFGLNLGYMEGTIISGFKAAQAIRSNVNSTIKSRTIWVSAGIQE